MQEADAALALLFYPVREHLIATLQGLEARPEVVTELS